MIHKMPSKIFGSWPKKYSDYQNSKIVLLPVPYDETSTWIKGADKGAGAILEASFHMELYDIETDYEVYRNGIFTAPSIEENSSPEKMVSTVKKETSRCLKDNKFIAVIGGEHSVSIGSIQAHKEKYQDMGVLQLDAHSDTREKYHGSRYNHACVMARARELCPIVQVGIRSMDIKEKKKMNRDRVFFAQDIDYDDTWMDKAISFLPEDFYLTFDLDALDISIMPSTGTPEPGGLSYRQTLKFLKKAIQEKNLIGFDVVELCPQPNNKSPDMLAAQLIYKILSYKFSKK
jgi:agmatinase